MSKDRIADLLESFRYDRGNLILANSLHKLIRDQNVIRLPGLDRRHRQWHRCQDRPCTWVDLPNTPKRAVRYSTDGSAGTFRVSGSSARLAGSTDLAKTYAHSGDALVEPAVYRELPHPTLLIYPLDPTWR